MKFTNILYIIILNINIYLFETGNSDTIRFAYILTRTGAHSPSKLKKIINEKKEVEYKDIFGYKWLGENELTSVGKRQQFYLGHRNYLKYKNILYSEIYHPKELLAVSSQCNKTIQSSYANLHGLYQKRNIILTDKNIKYGVPPLNSNEGYANAKKELDEFKYTLPNNIQIVPVHHFYEKSQEYLLEKVDNCPSMKKYYDDGELLAKNKREEILNYKSETNNNKTYGNILVEILNEEKIYKDRYDIDYLKNNSTFFKIMAETYICDYFEAVNLDKFIKKGINKYKLLQMFEEYFGEISIGGGIKNKDDERAKKTLEVAQNVNYALFSSLLGWTKTRIKFDAKKNFDLISYSAPKIVLYSSHHESIESLYYFLKENFDLKDAKNSLYVNFTSFIGVELYRKNNEKNEYTNKDYYIKLFYDNKQIGKDISYTIFTKKLKDKIVSLKDIKKFCSISNQGSIKLFDSKLEFIILGGIMILIFLILIGIIIYLMCSKKQNKVDMPSKLIHDDDDDDDDDDD